MKHEFKDFIGIFDDPEAEECCNFLIQKFENAKKSKIYDRQQENINILKVAKDDLHVFSADLENPSDVNNKFYEKFWGTWYKKYSEEYGILATLGRHTGISLKIQKTMPGQGYHIWHCESDTFNNSRRILAWILYLNDVDDGGETEFLYQHMRVKPKKGRVVVWPAYFTHPHRGNPPLSGVKYIATGWISFIEPDQKINIQEPT